MITAAVIPLLFEANMEKEFDYIIVVKIDSDIQIKRLVERNNFSEEEAKRRINSQLSSEEKAKKADFLIDNSLNPENTRSQLKNILKIIKGSGNVDIDI